MTLLDSTSDFLDKLVRSTVNNGIATILIAPIINWQNQVCSVACKNDWSSARALREMYSGSIYGTSPSLRNLTKGLGDHYSKEMIRAILFRSAGLGIILPAFEERYGGNAPLYYSMLMSLAEMAINPFDTRRVLKQGLKGKQTIPWISHQSYAGSGSNGVRQFLTWYGFTSGDRYATHLLDEHRPDIDHHSWRGIGTRVLIANTLLTILAQSVEVVKIKWQFKLREAMLSGQSLPKTFFNSITARDLTSPQQLQAKLNSSEYLRMISGIWRQQGFTGFYRGLVPKLGYNTFMTTFAILIKFLAKEDKDLTHLRHLSY